MKKSFAVAALVVLCATTANATNMWLSLSGDGSPAGEVPMVMQGIGDEGWLYIWARPDQGQILQNFSLNATADHSDIIWFTAGHVDNPLLGVQSFPPPPKNILRYEFTNDSANADLGMDALRGMQGFSVANQTTIGAGLGFDFDPLLVDGSWRLGSIHWKAHRPGHIGIFLEIGANGLNNAGQSSAQTSVVFGDLEDNPLNGNNDRQVPSNRPDAIIWIIPEPSSIALAFLGLIALIPCLRKR
jgi:hypothetical protein